MEGVEVAVGAEQKRLRVMAVVGRRGGGGGAAAEDGGGSRDAGVAD